MTDATARIITPPTPMTISQIAIVVRDMEKSLKAYTENLGWGPWSVFDYKPPLLHDTMVRGEPVEYRMIGAETHVGGLGLRAHPAGQRPEHLPGVPGHLRRGRAAHRVHEAQRRRQRALKGHWRERGADVLMSGRIGDSIEFYYLDTGPIIKWVLESGNGHAIELKPSYIYP